MATIFSETLIRLRKEAGFPTAYRFYHSNGGEPVLKISYRKYLAMSNDTGVWTAAKLAPLLGLREPACARALQALAAAKICKLSKPGDYRCPLAAKMVEYPQMSADAKIMIDKLLKYQEELIAAGSRAWMRRGIIRADADNLCNFFPLMGLNLSAAHTYAITEKSKKSAIYAVEGRITKLKDF